MVRKDNDFNWQDAQDSLGSSEDTTSDSSKRGFTSSGKTDKKSKRKGSKETKGGSGSGFSVSRRALLTAGGISAAGIIGYAASQYDGGQETSEPEIEDEETTPTDPLVREKEGQYEVSKNDLEGLAAQYKEVGQDRNAAILRSVLDNPSGSDGNYKFFLEDDKAFIRSRNTDQEIPEDMYDSAIDYFDADLDESVLLAAVASAGGMSADYSSEERTTSGTNYDIEKSLENHAAAEGLESVSRTLEK